MAYAYTLQHVSLTTTAASVVTYRRTIKTVRYPTFYCRINRSLLLAYSEVWIHHGAVHATRVSVIAGHRARRVVVRRDNDNDD